MVASLLNIICALIRVIRIHYTSIIAYFRVFINTFIFSHQKIFSIVPSLLLYIYYSIFQIFLQYLAIIFLELRALIIEMRLLYPSYIYYSIFSVLLQDLYYNCFCKVLLYHTRVFIFLTYILQHILVLFARPLILLYFVKVFFFPLHIYYSIFQIFCKYLV